MWKEQWRNLLHLHNWDILIRCRDTLIRCHYDYGDYDLFLVIAPIMEWGWGCLKRFRSNARNLVFLCRNSKKSKIYIYPAPAIQAISNRPIKCPTSTFCGFSKSSGTKISFFFFFVLIRNRFKHFHHLSLYNLLYISDKIQILYPNIRFKYPPWKKKLCCNSSLKNTIKIAGLFKHSP